MRMQVCMTIRQLNRSVRRHAPFLVCTYVDSFPLQLSSTGHDGVVEPWHSTSPLSARTEVSGSAHGHRDREDLAVNAYGDSK